MAFFQFGRLPTKRPMRFSLPRTIDVRTATTSTFQSFWTACANLDLVGVARHLEQQLRLQRRGIELAFSRDRRCP